MQHNLPRQRVLPLPASASASAAPQATCNAAATRALTPWAPLALPMLPLLPVLPAASVAVGVAVNEYFSQVNFHSYYESASPLKLESSCRCAAPLADYISLASTRGAAPRLVPAPLHSTLPQLSTSLADENETRRSAKKLRIRRVDAADLY